MKKITRKQSKMIEELLLLAQSQISEGWILDKSNKNTLKEIHLENINGVVSFVDLQNLSKLFGTSDILVEPDSYSACCCCRAISETSIFVTFRDVTLPEKI